MSDHFWRVCDLARRQHDVVAIWQLARLGMTRSDITSATRGLRRVHRGVCALGDLGELGWFMAAALALGPAAVLSHRSALQVMGLRPYSPGDIDVTVPGYGGRARRDGIRVHRRQPSERWVYKNIPITSPAQSLEDADLEPHELYRALEEAEKRRYTALPTNDVVRLKQSVRGYTRSDTEAAFLMLCHRNGFPLPLVNQYLNGFETDFHWPQARLVVEVDGFEHHKERENFNRDRYRGLVHRARGYEVVRVSADHVYDVPELVLDALRRSVGLRRVARGDRTQGATRRRT